jgi:hypothetical protein
VIVAVLRAAVDGPFFSDGDFHPLMGVDREEMRLVLACWPDCDDVDKMNLAVNNAFANLPGYDGVGWEAWSAFSRARPWEVNAVFHRWREEVGDPLPSRPWRKVT